MSRRRAYRMPFGFHKGKTLGTLPDDYLGWLASLPDLWPALRSAVEQEIKRRGMKQAEHASRATATDVCPNPEIARQLIDRGLRVMARENHPDVGGDHERMISINNCAAWLRSQLRRLPA
jgi:uncharacterized protein (DUF3820 family)